MNWPLYTSGLGAIVVLALVGWVLATARRNVAIVDSLWGLFFVAATLAYLAPGVTPRGMLVLALVGLWALRLSGYVTWRNWGEPEDRRYRAIRANHEPGFAWKSLYIIFGLQSVLAWIISLPLYAGATGSAPLGALDVVGAAVWLAGFLFETIGDAQLARFKSDPRNKGAVMDRGLWRYTRHPNYFGETLVWWGLYLVAVSAGGWWSILGPIVITFMLLKVSGVSLLEKDIGERRPAYADYVARTSAFLPRPPRPATTPR